MSLNHKFFLVKTDKYPPHDYSRFHHRSRPLCVDFDLVEYLHDSLLWIPTINPAKHNESGYGLNYYGPTAILVNGAPIASRIFMTWANLFGLGPELLELTGVWGFDNGESGSGHYSHDTYKRALVTKRLSQLAGYCDQVAKSKGAYYLLHLGV